MSYFTDKTIFVTGGTGSWGKELIGQLLLDNPKEIRVFSRGEHAQVETMRAFNDPRLNFYIGDVRDRERLIEAMRGVDVVFHLAALKHVPVCERHIWETVQTNVTGTKNVVDAALANNVPRAIYISSDKAVAPVNLYGHTKAISEKLFTTANTLPGQTVFSCIRAGNVIGTHGSVVPLFQAQLARSNKITLTDKRMTRFFEPVHTMIAFLIKAASEAKGGEIIIPKMPSVRVETLAQAMIAKLGNADTKIEDVGIRPGEKIHELLVSNHEISRTAEFPDRFVVLPYNFLLDKASFADYHTHITSMTNEYGSGTIPSLNVEETTSLLKRSGHLS